MLYVTSKEKNSNKIKLKIKASFFLYFQTSFLVEERTKVKLRENITFLMKNVDKGICLKNACIFQGIYIFPRYFREYTFSLNETGITDFFRAYTSSLILHIRCKIYTWSGRPTLEYGANAWATAAKTNTSKLDRVQNLGLRTILVAMKSTPVSSLEKTAGVDSLESRRQASLARRKKMKRLPDHPLHTKLQQTDKKRD